MKIYGLIGNPLSHSFSKKYFTEKFLAEHITGCEYRNYEIKNLSAEIPLLKNDFLIHGLNVTIPYKSEILNYVDIASDECREINACNCIKITGRKWQGFNTDIIGFAKSFAIHLKPHHKNALILGTGGSSKAVGYALKNHNIDFLFVSREKKNSLQVITYEDISPALINDFRIVINTTPIGMFPNVHAYPKFPYEWITADHYFFDLVYNPSKTMFLAKAEAMGAVIKNGEDMLVIQAEESWRIWNS